MKRRIYQLFLLVLSLNCYSLKSMGLSDDQTKEGLYDYHLYLTVQRIKDITEAALISNRVAAIGGRGCGYNSSADHYSPQTKTGLFLHIIGPEAAPATLSTPWGSTYLVRAYNEQAQFQPVVSELLSHLMVELLSNSPNQVDQVYKILAVDGETLALPQEQEKIAYHSAETVSVAFDEFAQWQKQKLQ